MVTTDSILYKIKSKKETHIIAEELEFKKM